MNNQPNEQITRWRSRGKKISLSSYHKDMYIIDHPDGGWHNIHSMQAIMLAEYPPDMVERRDRAPISRSFTFNPR